MAKRKKDWIRITTPEGKDMICSPDYIKKLLDLKDVNSYLFLSMYRRIQQLEDNVDVLERPIIKQKILELLKGNGFHTEGWITRRVWHAKYRHVRELQMENRLTTKKSRYHTLYGLA